MSEKAQHTPGPWKRIKLDEKLYINPDRKSGEYALIAKINRNSLPNARLIAAAPELLEALKCFMECQAPDGTTCTPNNADFDKGRAAIAKATGSK